MNKGHFHYLFHLFHQAVDYELYLYTQHNCITTTTTTTTTILRLSGFCLGLPG